MYQNKTNNKIGKQTKGVEKMKGRNLFLVVLVTLLLVTNLFAGVKSIARITGTDKGTNMKMPVSYNSVTYFAGTLSGTVDGASARFYCIDLHHNLAMNNDYQDVYSTGSYITYVLNNYYPYKTLPYPGSLVDTKEAAAVQLAIWHFSDGLAVDSCQNNTDVIARALQIINDAKANHNNIVPVKTLVIYVPSNQSFEEGNPVKFRVEVYDELNRPVPNVTVTLQTTAGSTLSATTAVTNASGFTDTLTLTPASGTMTATITARATVTIPHGTEYHNVAAPNDKQKLVIAKPVVANKISTQKIDWFKNTNLSLVKLSNKTYANNGDNITYTLIIKNTGLNTVTNVTALDLLPNTLTYISSNGNGSYNPQTGLWTVGNLAAGDSAKMVIETKANLTNPTVFNLGVAQEFNVFVLNDINQMGTDTQGKMAVKNDAILHSYSVGEGLAPHSGNVLVVGRRLTFLSGRVANGSAVYGSWIDTAHANLADDGIHQGNPIDFAAAETYLINLSKQLSLITPNGTVTKQYNQIFLNGNNPNINVFNVNGADLTGISNFEISVPAGSTVLVNVNGKSIQWNNGYKVNGTSEDKVMINFFEAENIHLAYIGLKACLLAPTASLYFPSGLITGTVIMKNISGQGQFNNMLFTGNITQDVKIDNVAQIVSAAQYQFGLAPMAAASVIRNNPTNVKENVKAPRNFNLNQNYPNPFNPSTKISFEIPTRSNVKVTVYNSLGAQVEVLVNGVYEAGNYEINFNASNLSTGIYYYEMLTDNFKAVKKMILTK